MDGEWGSGKCSDFVLTETEAQGLLRPERRYIGDSTLVTNHKQGPCLTSTSDRMERGRLGPGAGAQSAESLHSMHKALGLIPALHKQDVVSHTGNPSSTQEIRLEDQK